MSDRPAQVLRGGLLVDGTGTPARRVDVRIEGGQITQVGSADTSDAQVIDLDGLVLAPGFIDPHTHFDAQVLWDPDLTPSTWHGITTVVIGNCGFGIAPTREQHRDLICRTLENVEGMPLETLQEAIDWRFESFPEYLDLVESSPRRANVAALVGHTPLRVFVMGDEASSRAATDTEIARICSLAKEALLAGAIGIATSRGVNHAGAYGAPVPSRLATRDELHALARVLADVGHGIFQAVAGPGIESPEEFSELAGISGGPVSWIPLFTNGETAHILDRTRALAGEVWPQMACRPIVTQVTLANPTLFLSLPSFERVLAAPIEVRARLYRDASWREVAGREAEARWGQRWSKLRVKESVVHRDLVDGPSLAELAGAQGIAPFDLLLDLALAEDLETRFELRASNDDDDEIAALLADPRTLLGLSDAGAHVRELCDAGYPTYLLGTWARDRQALSLEQAVWRLTAHPAGVFRLPSKGLVAVGYDADLVAFDPASVGSTAPERVVDLPAGSDRLVTRSIGIEHVWVSGHRTRVDGVDVDGERHGRVLRSAAS